MKPLPIALLVWAGLALNLALPAEAPAPVRFAIVGLVHDHARGFIPSAKARPDIQLAAIVEPDPVLRQSYAERYQLSTNLFYTTLEEMLDKANVQAVATFTSTFDHRRVVETCAARGVHVMMEKPLAVNMEHARAIEAAARKGGIQVVVNYETTWYPANHAAYALVHQTNAVGEVRKIVVHDGHPGPKEIGCSAAFLEWLTDPVLNGGGALTDFGCYGADLITWLMKGERPTSVLAVTQQIKPRVYPKVDDEATIVVTYPHAQGIIQASWNWPFNRKDMEIYGQTGYVLVPQSNRLRVRTGTGQEVESPVPALTAPHSDPLAYLAAVVRGEIRPEGLSSLPVNLVATEILDAARESARTGKRVVLSPDASRFDNSKYPKRLKRAESYVGIHFDFHAGPDCTEIGRNTTPAMVENIIDLVHPDYLQIDCKGHRGLSSYPTRVGNPAPGFVGDPLRIWREVTARRGVALFMHYSGVWDSEAILQHPDWAVTNADGSTNKNATSFFGPYASQLLVPQLRELACEYGVDGAWIDGECWASVPDYSPRALKMFREVTGITDVPRQPGAPHWYEFLQFNRDAFRAYLRSYIAEVKASCPEVQLCSNWAFTDHMAEPVSAPVDFLSGDYSPEDSVNSARLSARYLARQGKPWDLMAWSFIPKSGAALQKPAAQLKRESAVVLALGGGFEAYHRQKRDGSIYPEQMPVMAEVAEFCRERQAFCHNAAQVPQVAVLYSTAAHYRLSNGLFQRDLARMSGTLQALLESQQSVELLGEHHLTGRMRQYPLIVVPEWDYLDPQFKEELRSYAEAGGSLLLIGPQSAALFAAELDVTFEGSPSSTPKYLAGDSLVPTKGEVQLARLGGNAQLFGRLHVTNDLSSASQPAASWARLAKGKIAATYFAFGQGYLKGRNPAARRFLNALVRQLFPEPMVEVTGSPDVDVVVNRIQGKLAINLVNTAGPHQTEPILESIPAVGPLSLRIRQATKPSRIMLEPGGQSLAFEYHDGVAHVRLPRLEIHQVMLVD